MNENKKISEWYKNLKFKRKMFGGIDEADAWRQIKQLHQLYAEQTLTQPELEAASNLILQRRKRLFNIKTIFSFLQRLLVTVGFFGILFGMVFGITSAKDHDNAPKIYATDLMLYYRMEKNFKTGDLLVYEQNGQQYIGRVIARANDTVEILNEENRKGVFVNGTAIMENEIFYETRPYDNDIEYPITLQEDEVFILADHRDGSTDSRIFGAVKKSDIQGKVITILRRSSL